MPAAPAAHAQRNTTFTIGELAREFDLTTRAIRCYSVSSWSISLAGPNSPPQKRTFASGCSTWAR